MSPELDKQLCENYPEIFCDRHADMSRTAMCWGFECGDGWYALIDTLCSRLMHSATTAREDYHYACEMFQHIIDYPNDYSDLEKSHYTGELLAVRLKTRNEAEQHIPVAVQVKEKWGELCFYVKGDITPEQFEIIRFAETLSGRICEECGNMKHTKTYRNKWHKTLCPACAIRLEYDVPMLPSQELDIMEPDEDTLWGI